MSALLRALVLSVPLVVTTFAPIASAEDAAADATEVVHPKNGDVYSGQMVEKVQADHVTLSPPPWPPSATSFVEIETDNRQTTLARRTGWVRVFPGRGRYRSVWEDVCVAPCAHAVDARVLYRIEGEGVSPSSSFFLPSGATRLRVHTGSFVGLASGVVLSVLGGGAAVMGGFALGISANGPNAQPQSDARDTFRGLGIGLLSAGVVALAIGIPLWLANTTQVTDSTGRALGKAAPRKVQVTPAGILF